MKDARAETEGMLMMLMYNHVCCQYCTSEILQVDQPNYLHTNTIFGGVLFGDIKVIILKTSVLVDLMSPVVTAGKRVYFKDTVQLEIACFDH